MKRRNKLFLLALIPLAALASCATTYQKEGVFSNGYSDFRLNVDKFVVSYRANEYTPPEKVMKYALKRAAELTVKNGFHYFAVIDEIDTSKEHTVIDKKREGGSERSTLSHLHYPSIRLTIQCYDEKPAARESVDAHLYLTYN